MYRTTFKIAQMDCGAEENLVRLQLQGIEPVRALDFDLEARTVAVTHQGGLEEIAHAIGELKLGDTVLRSEPIDASEAIDALDAGKNSVQRKTLWAVLAYAALAVLFHFRPAPRGRREADDLASPELAARNRRIAELEKRFRDLEGN